MKTHLLTRTGLFAGLVLALASAYSAENQANIDKTFRVNSGGTLTIAADQGAIEVNPDGGDQVHVMVTREAKHATKAEAEKLLANHEITLNQDGDSVSITAKNNEERLSIFRIRRAYLEVHYRVSVPKKYNVNLRTSGGDISLADLEGEAQMRTSSGTITAGRVSGKVAAHDSGGDVRLTEAAADLNASTSSGSIEIGKVRGKAELADSGGNIRVEDASGDVLARTSSGGITLKAVKGNVEARNSGGDITIEASEGRVSARTSSGAIHVGRAGGDSVDAKNSGGDVEIGEAGGSVMAETSSGHIEVGTAKGRVEAKNSGGDIRLGECDGPVVAHTSSGTIHIKQAKGAAEVRNSGGDVKIDEADGDTVARTSSGSIVIRLAKGRVDAKNSGGNVEVTEAHAAVSANTSSGEIALGFVEQPKSDCRLDVSGGGIQVSLPRSAGVELDAQSSGGKVVTDLPVTVTVQGETHEGALRGKINGGGPALVLRSSSGDIRLRTGSL